MILEFVGNPRKSSQGMIIGLMQRLEYIQIFNKEYPQESPTLKISKIANVWYPLLRTHSIATQFGIKLNIPVGSSPLLQIQHYP